MNIYNLRKNYSVELVRENCLIKGKLAFKTKETDWLNTQFPVVIPISTHSAFHEGVNGEMKMEAFIATLKQSVEGNMTILMTEKAHLNVWKLKTDDAFELCMAAAQQLAKRFRKIFEGCTVVYWHDYIDDDPSYSAFKEKVLEMYAHDPVFQHHLREDAIASYGGERKDEFPNKELYIERTILDILEQCVCLLVLKKKGYRKQFYPGRQYAAVEYVNRNQLIALIHVFITIERKKTLFL